MTLMEGRFCGPQNIRSITPYSHKQERITFLGKPSRFCLALSTRKLWWVNVLLWLLPSVVRTIFILWQFMSSLEPATSLLAPALPFLVFLNISVICGL